MTTRSEAGGTPVDPFATDLFLSEDGSAASPERPSAAGSSGWMIRERWHEGLPRVSGEEARSSANAARLFVPFSVAPVARVLSRYAQISVDRISISCVDLREQDSQPEVLAAAPRVFACLTIAPAQKPLIAEIEAAFSIALIDLMLGGEGAGADELRPLSRVESAVVEFLCLGICRELNEEAGASLISLARIAQSPPGWIAGESSSLPEDRSRHLIASFAVTVGKTCGMIKVHFPASAMSEIAATLARTAGNTNRTAYLEPRLKQLQDLVPDVQLALMVGKSEVTVDELSRLEPGDVLVVTEPRIRRINGGIEGSVLLRVGDSENSTIRGRTIPSAETEGSNDSEVADASSPRTINLLVEGVSSQHSETLAERFDMNEQAREEQLGEGGTLIEGLLLTVNVELKAQRLRMDELAQLRVGQIIDLGCRASDPVDLLIDGRTIARGQLVDIEGRLGVSILQVAV
jgi:type III secretion system YscQ/HrcQ family protein